jgi:hypothetical protein
VRRNGADDSVGPRTQSHAEFPITHTKPGSFPEFTPSPLLAAAKSMVGSLASLSCPAS